MSDWEYISGETHSGGAVRVHRSRDGLIGRVARIRGNNVTGRYTSSKTKYFVWALPDTAPEYDTEEEARTAEKQMKVLFPSG